MEFSTIITQALNGLTVGMILVLIASGLSFIAGFMHIPNMAHTAFYALGAYGTLTFVGLGLPFLPAALVAALLTAGLGALMEMTLLRPLHRRDETSKLLVTLGVALVTLQVIEMIWGANPLSLDAPAFTRGIVRIGDVIYPGYRIFLLAVATLLMGGLWWLVYRTRWGLILRAGVLNPPMLSALGVNVPLTFTRLFAGGSLLAALAGALTAPLIGVFPTMGSEIVIDAFVVLVIGGMGSLTGAIVAALILGQVETFGLVFAPGVGKAFVYLLMIGVLLWRPEGLFGRKVIRR